MYYAELFSATITDVQRLADDTTCLTVAVNGEGRPWFGDELELRSGAQTVGRFRVSGMAVLVGGTRGEALLRLISADPPARAARPGNIVRSQA